MKYDMKWFRDCKAEWKQEKQRLAMIPAEFQDFRE